MSELLAKLIEGNDLQSGWGIMPFINIGSLKIPSYSLFVFLGLIAGIIVFYYEARKNKSLSENTFYLAIAAIIGGTLGAKIPIWIINYKYLLANYSNIGVWLSGRTIVGGLIGGFIAIELTKKYLGIKEKKGNLFAPAIAIGIAIGRIGCFLRGCCYGKPTSLPWGVNFGDGILRHPTQIYESIFMLVMFIYMQHRKSKNPYQGQLFKIVMIGYFTFRFFIEFIRVEPVIFAGLTLYQLVSLFVILYFTRGNLKSFIKRKILYKQ